MVALPVLAVVGTEGRPDGLNLLLGGSWWCYPRPKLATVRHPDWSLCDLFGSVADFQCLGFQARRRGEVESGEIS